MQHRASNAINKIAPTTDPTTMPAICPPLNPWWLEDAAAPELVAVGAAEVEELVNSGGMVEKVGSVTP